MRTLASHRLTLMTALIAIMAIALWPGTPPTAHAASLTVSTVFVSPVDTCCAAPSMPYNMSSDQFTVNVNVNLASGESINGFDVRVNYTNAHTIQFQGVLEGSNINYSRNIFSAFQNTQVVVECINDVTLIQGSNGCPTDDSPVPGQVHFAETLVGSLVYGPYQGPLFTMSFLVTGLGNSTFIVDRANLSNPNADPSNPGLLNPQYIPVLKEAGIFGNSGVISFFNFQPGDTSVSTAILPNQAVVFDAGGSFVPSNSSDSIRLYSWNFGDGTLQQNRTAGIYAVDHKFAVPGRYNVSLKVWDAKNETGSLTRQVVVLPALGNLALIVKDQLGTVQSGNVLVKLFNSSSSPVLFANQTVDQFGDTQFNNLTPGNYYLTFTGQGVVQSSKTESILPGMTTQDTVYLSTVSVSKPPDYSGIIYIGSTLGGLVIVASVIFHQKRKSGRGSVKRTSKAKNR